MLEKAKLPDYIKFVKQITASAGREKNSEQREPKKPAGCRVNKEEKREFLFSGTDQRDGSGRTDLFRLVRATCIAAGEFPMPEDAKANRGIQLCAAMRQD